MALSETALATSLETILDTNTTPADSADFATKVADAVDAYLSSAVMDGFSAPGINPSGPTTDTTNPSATSSPVPVIKATTFRTSFLADISATYGGGARNFTESSAALKADIEEVNANSDAVGYAGTGVTVASVTPSIDDAWDVGQGGGTHTAVAAELASQIHSCVTSAVYTVASYERTGGFVGANTPPDTLSIK